MENNYTYCKNEKVYSTVDDIVDFLLNNKLTDDISFNGYTIKNLYKYHNNINIEENFYVSSEGFSNKKINGHKYNGNEESLYKIILDNLHIIFVIIDDKPIVLLNIVEYNKYKTGSEEKTFSLVHSEYSRNIIKNNDKSKKTIKKYAL